MDEQQSLTLNLDLSQQRNFIRFYNNLPETTSSTVRIFCHDDYYTVHDRDMQVVQDEANIPCVVKHMGEAPLKLSFQILGKSTFEGLIRQLLLVLQRRVEVYTRKAGENRTSANWQVQYRGSPGNLVQFEEILFVDTNNIVVNSVVMAIKIGKDNQLSLAMMDHTEMSVQLVQFTDNEFFTELEGIVARIAPKECLVSSGDGAVVKKLVKIVKRNGVMVTQMKRSDFDPEDAGQDLNRLLHFADGQDRNYRVIPDLCHADLVSSLSAIIKYLNLIADQTNYNQFRISTMDVNSFVRLDNAAMESLNIYSEKASSKNDTIFGILDSCATKQGRRLLVKWLKQPLRDSRLIEERLEVVEALVNDAETRNLLATSVLRNMPDLMLLARKLTGKAKATLQDCFRAYQAVDMAAGLIQTLTNSKHKPFQAMLIDPVAELLSDMEMFQVMVEKTLDLSRVDMGEFLVKHTFDKELTELHDRKMKVEEMIAKCHRNVATTLGLDTKIVKLDVNDQHGHIYRVTGQHSHLVRECTHVQLIDTVKGNVRFVDKKLTPLSASYRDIVQEYKEQQKSVVDNIIDVASGYADTLRNLNLVVAKVDVLVAFANTAANARIPFVRPKLLPAGSGKFSLMQMRHPCLEAQDVSVIPNDLELDRNGYTTRIITGPNMGGKSTYMRTAGVCILLAHIGSFVPCESAVITNVDCILTRIGARDCEAMGLSTFMLEMIDTCGVVRSATSNSFAVIDELGRGTSTFDGYGVALSVLEHLVNKVKCFTLFATHFHELTNIAETNAAVQNCHVTAIIKDSQMTPLYQVLPGRTGQSYGIHCAKLADYPEHVLQKAREYEQQLQNTCGYKYLNDLDCESTHQVIEEGMKLMCSDIPSEADIDKLSEADMDNILSKIKERVLASDNAYIKGLVEPFK